MDAAYQDMLLRCVEGPSLSLPLPTGILDLAIVGHRCVFTGREESKPCPKCGQARVIVQRCACGKTQSTTQNCGH